MYTESGKLYGLAFNAGQREVLRANFDGEDVRVLGRAKAKQPGYWAQTSRTPQLTVEGGFVYFGEPGTLIGSTSASKPGLDGVTCAADSAIYRLPE